MGYEVVNRSGKLLRLAALWRQQDYTSQRAETNEVKPSSLYVFRNRRFALHLLNGTEKFLAD